MKNTSQESGKKKKNKKHQRKVKTSPDHLLKYGTEL
jgi:hypothetical protein